MTTETKLMTYYTSEEMKSIDSIRYEDDFLNFMCEKRHFHMDQLCFKVDNKYQRAVFISEGKSSSRFLINGTKYTARYDKRIGFHINKNCLIEMNDSHIERMNYINSLSKIELIKLL